MLAVIRARKYTRLLYLANLKAYRNATYQSNSDESKRRLFKPDEPTIDLTDGQADTLFLSKRVFFIKHDFVTAVRTRQQCIEDKYIKSTPWLDRPEYANLSVTTKGRDIAEAPFGLLLAIQRHYGNAITFFLAIVTFTLSIGTIRLILSIGSALQSLVH